MNFWPSDQQARLIFGPRSWLVENGPKELELLFRAILYHPSVPILIADDDRHYRDAISGAGKLLGLSREKIIGRSLDDFIEPSFKPKILALWQDFLQQGTLRLLAPDGSAREVRYKRHRENPSAVRRYQESHRRHYFH